ncbi:MAG: hypothetical protein AB7S68_02400 [Polyangiaceae bacterium]
MRPIAIPLNRWLAALLALFAGLTTVHGARAQPTDPPAEPAAPEPDDPRPKDPPPQKKPQEDPEGNTFPRSGSEAGTPLRSYDEKQQSKPTRSDDARGYSEKPGWESEDYVLLPARAVLFPAKLLVDIVFTPLEVLLTGIDRYKVVPRVVDLFYFDKAHTAGFYPTIASETGYGLSYGAKVFDNDVAGHEEKLSFAGKFGGRYVQAYETAFEGDRVGGSRLWLETRTRYEREPGILFFGFGGEGQATSGSGLGPRETDVATRFQQERVLGLVRAGGTLGEQGELTKLGLFGVYNRRRFDREQRSFPEPSIEQVYDTARIPGFDSGVNTVELGVSLVHDTRDQEFASEGSYLELLGGGVVPAQGYRYWHFGGELTKFIDLYRHTRVLALRAALEGVVGDEEHIPFVELPRLGGVHDLRGYLSDRFRDKLSAVTTAEYRYPIHQLLSGKVFVDAGNVGRDFDNLVGSTAFEDWKVGAGGGFLIHTDEDVVLSIDLAYGDQFTFFVTTSPLEFFHKRNRQL